MHDNVSVLQNEITHKKNLLVYEKSVACIEDTIWIVLNCEISCNRSRLQLYLYWPIFHGNPSNTHIKLYS